MANLCAITTVFNPAAYESRFRLFRCFRNQMAASGIPLYTVELAIGGQQFAVTDSSNRFDIQVRSGNEIWQKENLVNIALAQISSDYDAVAWIDADLFFVRPDWVSATKEKIQDHSFVQMFSHLVDLGARFEPLEVHDGFAYRHLRKNSREDGQDRRVTALGQTGAAWAARRETLQALGGLLETSILGSNDYFMALAMVGAVTPETTQMPGSNYAASLLDWQRKFQSIEHHSIGYVETTILHYWHGRREDRGYNTRWRILVENQFDPLTDLKRNADGVLELTDRSPRLRKAIQAYFRSRNEDD